MAEDKTYDHAPTVAEFKRDHPQLVGKGKRLILCDHLKNRTMTFVIINLWIGDYSRVLLCPICAKLYKSTLWENMQKEVFAMRDTFIKAEYLNYIEEAGK